MYQNIVVCIDHSDVSKSVLHQAVEIAGRHQAKIFVVSIVDTRNWPDLDHYIYTEEDLKREIYDKTAKAIDELLDAYVVPKEHFEIIVEMGSPRTVITQKIVPNVRADLIVIGATGVHGLDKLLIGSVTNAILATATCDVLVVKRPNDVYSM